MAITFNHNDKLYVSGSNVGIGTDSPSSILHLENAGNTWAKFINTSGTNQRLDVGTNSSSQHFVFGYGDYPVLFGSNGAERMRITSGGNVGIGTTSPTNKLNVVGGAGDDIIAKFKSIGTGVSDYTEIHIENNGSDKLVMGSIGSNFTSADWTGARYIYSTAGKLYLKAKTDLQFFSGGTSVASHLRMTIADDGNVGIGTTSPGYKLEVDGNIGITESSTIAHLSGNGSGTLNINNTTGQINFLANGSTVTSMWITSSGITLNENVDVNYDLTVDGSVGIGTTSPGAKLEISSTDNVAAIINSTSQFTFLDIENDGTNRVQVGNASDGDFIVRTSDIERMRITSTGHIGMGTTVPYAYLHVKPSNSGSSFSNIEGLLVETGGSSNSYYALQVASAGGGKSFNVTNAGNVGIGTTSPGYKLDVGGGDFFVNGTNRDWGGTGGLGTHIGTGDFDIYSGTPGSGVHKLKVTNAGNVGIGTTSPSEKLHVAGNIVLSNSTNSTIYHDDDAEYLRITVGASTPDRPRIEITGKNYGGTNAGGDIILQSGGDSNVTGGDIRFGADKGTFTEQVTFKYNGNVGIGTTSPSYKLHISGDVYSEKAFRLNKRVHYNFNGQTFEGENTATEGRRYTIGRVYYSKNHWGYYGTIRLEVNTRYPYNGTQTFLVQHSGNYANIRCLEAHGSSSFLSNVKVELGAETDTGVDYSNYDIVYKDIYLYLDRYLQAGVYAEVDAHAFEYDKTTVVSGEYYMTTLFTTTTNQNKTSVSEFSTYQTIELTSNSNNNAHIAGNLGIGTTSPTRKLHVSAGATIPAVFDSTQDYTLGLARSGTEEWWLKTYTDGRFAIHENGDGDKVTIKAGGNVGIGTTSPSETLELVGTAKFQQAGGGVLYLHREDNTVATSNHLGSIRFGGGIDGTNDYNNSAARITAVASNHSGSYQWSSTDTASELQFMTTEAGGTTLSTRMTITHNGNVGIGTTSPSYKLDVAGETRIALTADDRLIINQATANTNFGLQFAYNGTRNWDIYNQGIATSPLYFYSQQLAGPALTLKTDGVIRFDQYGAGYLKTDASGNISVDTDTIEDTLQSVTDRGNSTTNNLTISNSSPDLFFETGATHYNWMLAAQENINAGFEISVGSQDADSSDDTWYPKLVVKQSGNVGIGTDSPLQKLDVDGNIQILDTNASDGDIFGYLNFHSTNGGSSGNHARIAARRDSAAAGQMLFYTKTGGGASEKMRITSGGNVGIGTTSPSTSLHVVKDASWEVARFEADSYPTATVYSQAAAKYAQLNIYDTRINSEPTMELRADTPHFNIRLDDTGNVLTIRDGGNVGIGTTSPGAKLDVAGTSRSDLHIFRSNQSAPTADAFIFRPADNTVALGTANTERVRIDSSGNVGIGTTSPNDSLDVNGVINSSRNIVSNTIYTAYTVRSSRTIDDYGGLNKQYFKLNLVTPGINTTGEASAHGFADLRFQLANNASSTSMADIMTLRPSGNVGIGTTTPSYKFTVSSGTDDIGILTASSDSGSYVGFLDNATSVIPKIGAVGNKLVLDANNIGVGITSPSYQFHIDNDALNTNNAALYVRNPNSSSGAVIAQFVGDSDAIQIKNINVGDYAIYNTQQSNGIALYDGTGGVEIHYNGATVLEADSNGGIKVTGQLSATGDVVAYSSDERLKENIKPIENAVDKIKQLKGVTFDWNEKSQELGFEPSTKTNDVGVIAQDVEAVFPQLVHLAPFDIGSDEEGKATSKTGEDYKTVNYARLTAVLIEAVKEQQQQIDELKEIINGLTK